MSDLTRLRDLQEVDLEIRTLSDELEEVVRRLSDEGQLPLVRAQFERIEKALSERSASARAAEREVERLSVAAGNLERRLYDGSVTNQREFDALTEQRDFASAERSSAEEGLLDVMVEIEELERSAARHRETIERLADARKEEVEDLSSRQSTISARISTLETERESRCVGIPQALMARYDSLRKTRGGRALAPLEGRMCGACRVEQPTGNLARARAGESLVECNSCRRILLAR